jgi:hypothetical protein
VVDDSLICSNHAAEITAEVGPSHYDPEMFLVKDSRTTFLRAAEDGSLTVEQTFNQAGIFFVLPGWEKANNFSRFEKLN